jgi:putative phosphoribosyl transferase
MYFHDRAEAGDKLADDLMQYRWENTAVLALSPGGVVVGEQIARRLHTTLSLLLTARISAPGDESLVLGTIDQTGTFTYNSMISAGEMEEYMEDMRGYLEEQKLRQMYEMTSIVGQNGVADPSQLEGRNIIIATDGVKNGLSYDAALNYLGRIRVDNFFTVSHYYTDEEKISPDEVMERINNVVARWA